MVLGYYSLFSIWFAFSCYEPNSTETKQKTQGGKTESEIITKQNKTNKKRQKKNETKTNKKKRFKNSIIFLKNAKMELNHFSFCCKNIIEPSLSLLLPSLPPSPLPHFHLRICLVVRFKERRRKRQIQVALAPPTAATAVAAAIVSLRVSEKASLPNLKNSAQSKFTSFSPSFSSSFLSLSLHFYLDSWLLLPF